MKQSIAADEALKQMKQMKDKSSEAADKAEALKQTNLSSEADETLKQWSR